MRTVSNSRVLIVSASLTEVRGARCEARGARRAGARCEARGARCEARGARREVRVRARGANRVRIQARKPAICQLPTADCNCEPQTQTPTANRQLPTADRKLQTANCKLQLPFSPHVTPPPDQSAPRTAQAEDCEDRSGRDGARHPDDGDRIVRPHPKSSVRRSATARSRAPRPRRVRPTPARRSVPARGAARAPPRAKRHPDAQLAHPPAHRERQQPVDPDQRQDRGEQGKAGQEHRQEARLRPL